MMRGKNRQCEEAGREHHVIQFQSYRSFSRRQCSNMKKNEFHEKLRLLEHPALFLMTGLPSSERNILHIYYNVTYA